MPFHYLEEIGTADIAFEATGHNLPDLFTAAADATMNVMIDNLDAIEPRETRQIKLANDKIDMLLFDFLQELIYFKDAERLLLRVRAVQIEQRNEKYFLKAEAAGECLVANRGDSLSFRAAWIAARMNQRPFGPQPTYDACRYVRSRPRRPGCPHTNARWTSWTHHPVPSWYRICRSLGHSGGPICPSEGRAGDRDHAAGRLNGYAHP